LGGTLLGSFKRQNFTVKSKVDPPHFVGTPPQGGIFIWNDVEILKKIHFESHQKPKEELQ
jgi:hypothetical protein